ncbi:MAG TPA: SpoIID/LytB domain-containing protein [Gaiellaceae bacterium]|nr:SpoIID/LytB domain-containing protein [Gaiellaceae bacterium]
MLRALRPILLCLPLLAAGAAVASPAQQSEDTVTSTTFVIRGRGWGHGVGMGQWGAFGQARRGVGYRKILAHYYPGTKLMQTPTASVRVLLADGRRTVKVASPVPFRLVDGQGEIHDLPPGSYVANSAFEVALEPDVPPHPVPGPLTFLRGTKPLELFGRQYRGNLQLQRVRSRLQAVNVVGVDPYIRGVVSQEVPDDWPLEVVKAQAVAARSYALAQAAGGSILYADTRSQVYGGVEAETPVGDKSVSATSKQVLMFDGKVATTFFFSSSGGRTADVEDVFVGGTPIPYLVSVPDPDDRVSPHHRWGPVVIPAPRASKLLGIPGTTGLRTVPVSGRASELVVSTRGGGERRLPASTVRRALDLRSTWITVGALTLSRPAGMAAPAAPLTLTGTAKHVKGRIGLEQKVAGAGWTDSGPVKLAADRSFTVEVVPEVTTQYRLTAADGVVSAPLRVPVSASARSAALVRTAEPRTATLPAAPRFLVDDPLAAQQWHLAAVRAFDFWPELPLLDPVTVAVVDTGIDLGHPDLADNVIASKSFVGGSADDPLGHGTFVAGLIAAEIDNAVGVAGIAFPARLLVARVATADGDIDAAVEAKAIRWAVDRGARVINLSIGGLRDPLRPSRDTFSQDEADAIAYAHSKGVVVVASVGNGDSAPSSPWPYASYPSALPHVVGVSSVTQSGAVPGFSNRDAVFNDLAAPGQSLVSTAPRSLTAERPGCVDQGYSPCAPPDLRDGSGTSFSAAQVSATAALLLAVNPKLTPEQVSMIIERSAVDAKLSSGCGACAPGRDARSGWGTLDVTAALEALSEPLPPVDRYESNDDAGSRAATIYGRERTVRATLDFWDDQLDVYRVNVAKGERLKAYLRGPAGTQTNLILWRPGTEHVEGLSAEIQERRVTQSARAGPNEAFSYRATEGGWYYVEVKMAGPGSGRYALRLAKVR